MTQIQIDAKNDAVRAAAADPYCQNNKTLYKTATFGRQSVMFSVRECRGISFDIWYRIENDVFVLIMVLFSEGKCRG